MALKGVKHVVISPGSRNAPLVMSFNRIDQIKCYSVIDERSAAFMALGMSKQIQEPVALLCTSGSAVLNYYPALVEAYYMQVPLLLISADRPADLIDRWDGQAIHQFEVFKPHILASFQTPDNTHEKQLETFFQIGIQAVEASIKNVHGPVHINVPLNEPLYDQALHEFEYPKFEFSSSALPERVSDLPVIDPQFFINFPKILILNGANHTTHKDLETLKAIKNSQSVVVLSDLISGKHAENSFQNWESVLLNANDHQKRSLIPDLFITTGKMVLNKTIKHLLKHTEIKCHWHIAENGYCADTFYSHPQIYKMTENDFFSHFEKSLLTEQNLEYFNIWKKLSDSQESQAQLKQYDEYNEFNLLRQFMNALPQKELNLHVSNSMSIRLLAYQAQTISPLFKIHANRGVSGIDGCSSTAVGMALLSQKENILITGDLAFLYDINAFLIEQKPQNLKVFILNNQSGGIFKNIEGPKNMKEANPYLYTPHQYTAKHIAQHHQIEYFFADDNEQFSQKLVEFNAYNGICFFEVLTNSDINTEFFNQYKHIQI